MKIFLLFALLALIKATASVLAAPPSLPHYEYIVKVNKSSNSAECTDLSDTLTNAFRNNKQNSSLELELDEGCFNLTSPELATFSGWTDIAIVGTGSKQSDIRCSKGVGLAFLSSVRVTLRNVKVEGCAGIQTSTSKDFTSVDSGGLSYLEFWVGVYFLSCSDVTMDHVEVSDTKGVGMVMYNCNGTNTFDHANFSGNYLDGDKLYRGGGVAVEFSFCQPGDVHCNDSENSSVELTRSNYTFHQCWFHGNRQTGDYNVTVVPYPHGTEHMAFGKGGGLSISFKGRSHGNSITIDTCQFRSNSALWGGGLYISFGDQSRDNRVTVTNSTFYFNVNRCKGTSPKWIQSGGGAQIDFIYYPPDDDLWPHYQPNVTRNSVSFYGTSFSSNMACWGGAVSIVVSRESPGHPVTNSILFESCRFKYNLASIAAAVDVSILQPDLVTGGGALMSPVFKDCHFFENTVSFSDAMNYQKAMGVVYANQVPLNFTGMTNFTHNSGSALAVYGTYVSVSESSEVVFARNSGRHGGAVTFVGGNAHLIVHRDVHVTFQNNSAERVGGAVYSIQYDEHELVHKPNCFFQYYKATLPPSEWNATFRFSGNLANSVPNSIYSTSLLQCVWSETTAAMPELEHIFCDHPWTFDNISLCESEIKTGPSNIYRDNEVSIPAVPGWKTHFEATTFDDFGTKIPSVFTAIPVDINGQGEMIYENPRPLIEVDDSTTYIADNDIIIRGVANQSATLLLQTLDPKAISSLMLVKIKACPFSYVQINCTAPNEHMACHCECAGDHLPGVSCDDNTHNITVTFGMCLTYQYNGTNADWSKPAVVGRCPFHSEVTTFLYDVSYHPEELSHQICTNNRTGLLCSQCVKGSGVDVNDYRFPCVKCHARYSWLLYIVAELIPIIAFFVVMASFNISATSAPMNAFVFFSQIVTIPYFHNPYALMFGYREQPSYKVLEALVSFPYSIWNLDFFVAAAVPGFCLYEGLGTLDVIALKYLNAFLPLVLIILSYVLIELHDRNFRVVRWLCHPFRKCSKKIYKNRERKKSIIDVIATFLLLSYNKILYVSFSLFISTNIYDANSGKPFGDGHLIFYFDASKQMYYGGYLVLSLTAIIIFILFVALPPLFFVFYPLRCSQKLIDKLPFRIALRTFADAFNGDFRDGTFKDGSRGDRDCRRYAGYYFIFRVIVFIIFITELTLLKQYFVQQLLCTFCIVLFSTIRPYKENFYNRLDTAAFTLLAVLNAFSFYNSQLFHSENRIELSVFWINYVLMFLPLVYIVCYAVYLILLWIGCLKPRIKAESETVIVGDSSSIGAGSEEGRPLLAARDSRESEEDVPDRLVNPQNYNSRNLYKPLSENHSDRLVRNQRATSMQGSSEKSFFNGRRDRMLVPYGSLNESFPTEHHSEPIWRPGSGRK